MWISRHALNNSLVVFIHGIWGSRWTTWKSYVDFFQRLPSERPLLRNYDVYLFTYVTQKFQQPPLRPTVVRDLRFFLEEHNDRYDTVVLVCHSQGGLVAKLYVLEELMGGRGLELKIDLILTLNTPNRGANWRNIGVSIGLGLGSILKKLWIVDKFFIWRQLADMAPYSENIRFLKENWGHPYISSPRSRPTKMSRYIRSLAISGLKDRLVSKESAEGYDVDEPDTNFTGHSVDSKEVAAVVGRYLSEHEKPSAVSRELESVHTNPALLTAHKTKCLADAVQIIGMAPLRQWFFENYVNSRAFCFVDNFFDAFMRRPLRKLTLTDAFKTYVKRTLED